METVFRKDSICEKYWDFVWRKLSWEGINKSLHGSDGHYHAALGKIILDNNQDWLWIRVAVHGMGEKREKRLTPHLLTPSLDGYFSPLTTSKLLSSVTGYFFTEGNPCENTTSADLPTGWSLWLLREEKRNGWWGGSPCWGSGALPFSLGPGKARIFLSSSREMWTLWERRVHPRISRSWGGRARGAEVTMWGHG